MGNNYDYDYRRGRYDPAYYDEPPSRGQDAYDDSYYEGYGGEPLYRGYRHGGYYNEPYQRRYPRGYYNEPYSDYDYDRYEYGRRSREPHYRHDYEDTRRETYYRGGYGAGTGERGFFERAGDELRSWLGDEDAMRRRRGDETRRGIHVGRGPRGYQRSDERIREDINDRLTDDAYVDATDIEVSVNNSMVTLAGRVDSREEKRRAEDIADSVTGVTDVSNQLRVVSGARTASDYTQKP